jgi:hypothetical protein
MTSMRKFDRKFAAMSNSGVAADGSETRLASQQIDGLML